MKKRIIITIILFVLILGGFGCYYLYQYTELFGKKLLPTKINTIEIQYIPSYDIGTVEQLNTNNQAVIEIQKINLKDSDLNDFKKALQYVKKSEKKNEELYTVRYKVIINDNITVKIGDGTGDIQRGNEYTPIVIPQVLYSHIERITNKNNKDILQNITSDNVKVKLEGASITIKNSTNLNLIQKSLLYYPISIKEDYKTYSGGYKVELYLDNNTQVYLYDEKIGYIVQKDGEKDTSTYAIFTERLYELIYKIYEASLNK